MAPPLLNPFGCGTTIFVNSVFLAIYMKEKHSIAIWDRANHTVLRQVSLRHFFPPGSSVFGELIETDLVVAIPEKPTVFIIDVLSGGVTKFHTDDSIYEILGDHEVSGGDCYAMDSISHEALSSSAVHPAISSGGVSGLLQQGIQVVGGTSSSPPPAAPIHTDPARDVVSIATYRKLIAVGLADGTIQIHDRRGELLLSLSENHRDPSRKPFHIACHSSRRLVACFDDGNISWWPINEGLWTAGHIQRSRGANLSKQIAGLFFHPTLPIIVTIDKVGTIKYFRLASSQISNVFVEAGEEKLPTSCEITCASAHPHFNFIFVSYSDAKISSPEQDAPVSRSDSGSLDLALRRETFGIFSILTYRQSVVIPPHAPRPLHSSFFVTPNRNSAQSNRFIFPSESYYINDGALVAYSNALNTFSIAKQLPKRVPEIIEPYRLIYSVLINTFLIFCHAFDSAGRNTHGYLIVSGKIPNRGSDALVHARDACFGFPNDEIIQLLSSDGRSCQTVLAPVSEGSIQEIILPSEMKRIWQTPMPSVYLFLDIYNRLCLLTLEKKKATSRFSFDLTPQAHVIQVCWNASQETSEGLIPFFCGVVTTLRVHIFDKNLTEVASYPTTNSLSCFWIGMSLCFSLPNTIMYLTMKGHAYPLVSLPKPNSLILNVLCDRVILARYQHHKVVVDIVPVLLTEPLLMGFVHATNNKSLSVAAAQDFMHSAVRYYPCTKFGVQLISELQESGYCQLAMLLVGSNPAIQLRFPWRAFELALASLQFRVCLEMLRKQLTEPKSRGMEEFPTRAREFAFACLTYAQFRTAYEVATLLNDELLLVEICSLTKNELLHTAILDRRDLNPILKQIFLKETDGFPTTTFFLQPTTRNSNEIVSTVPPPDLNEFALQDWPIDSTSPASTLTNWTISKSYCLKMATKPYLYEGQGLEGGWLKIPFLDQKHSMAVLATRAQFFPIPSSLIDRKNEDEDEEIPGTSTQLDFVKPSDNIAIPKNWVTTDSTPLGLFKQGLISLELNQLEMASSLFSNCRSLLVLPEGGGLKSQHERGRLVLRHLVAYMFFVRLLLYQSSSTSPVEQAQQTLVMSQLPLHPRHKLIAMNMALKANLAVQNYAIAAELLQLLLQASPPSLKNTISNQLRQCESNELVDKHQFTTTLSYETLKPLQNKRKCHVCHALSGDNKMDCYMCFSSLDQDYLS